MAIADRINEMYTHVGDVYDTITNVDLPTNKNIQNIPQTIKVSYLEIMNNGIDRIWNNWEKVTGEGTSLTLNNTEQAPIKMDLKGNTSQTGTPTPTSPIPVNVVSGDNEVEICGKNLFDKDNANVLNANISSNGTISSNKNTRTIYIPIQPSTTYTISKILSSQFRASVYDNIPEINSVGTNTIANFSGTTITITSTSNSKYLAVFCYINTDTQTLQQILDSIQIEKGTATTYEPYQGNTYNIDLPVENLFDKNTIIQGKYINNSGNLVDDANNFTGDYIPINENTTYYLSSTSTDARRIAYYNSSKTFISRAVVVSNQTLTIPSNAKYVRLSCYNNALDTLQLELGSKANSYTPYGTTPIELCKIENQDHTIKYQDYFYKDSDKWYLHKEIGKVVLNGSELWQMHGSIASWFYCDVLDNVRYAISENLGISNYYSYKPYYPNATTLVNGEFTIGYGANNIGRVVMKNTDYTTVNTFKTWLNTHNTTVYYILSTSTNTEITDTTLINQLEELYIAKSKENQTNISQINNDLGFIINSSALKKG